MNLSDDIRRNLPWGLNPEFVEDMIGDLALLVVEGRITEDNLPSGIKLFLPALRRKYSSNGSVSLEQPIGEGITLGDTELVPSIRRRSCPNCRKSVKPSRTYCSPTCALVYAAHRRRRLDPEEVERLHKERWLPQAETARMLGVTVHAIDNVINRYGLCRNLPEICKVPGCEKPVFYTQHCKGHLAGNLCRQHHLEKQRQYQRKSRLKRRPLLSSEQRKENARKASVARWSKPEWADPLVRSQLGRVMQQARLEQSARNGREETTPMRKTPLDS